MNSAISIGPVGLARWVRLDDGIQEAAGIARRCTPEFLQNALKHLGDVQVVSASINRSGQYTPPPSALGLLPAAPVLGTLSGLPAFCDIVVKLRGAGGHVATITVWAPLKWNGRFLGTAGGGNRTEVGFGLLDHIRNATISVGVKNGFAAAKTDGANRSPHWSDWGLKEGTHDIDWELTENWVHRANHDMTVIAKTVIEALYGEPPKYSYAQGGSGGGRQVLVAAQRYPEDYDGIWSSDPAINWTRFAVAELWPALVMKELGAVAPAKFEAFRVAAIEACDGHADGLRDGIVGAFDPCDFDTTRLIGQSTSAGPITEADAEVVRRIWEGPRRRNGEFMWYGLRPSTESWGANPYGVGLCTTAEIDGQLQPAPFDLILGYVKAWLVRDLAWDWKTLTFEEYERLFDISVHELASIASDNPDLSAFGKRGGKILISHGTEDPLIPTQGTIEYYRRVIEAIGSEESTRRFARLYISEGDGHGSFNDPGPGLLIEDGMTALMKWVEQGAAPDEIACKTLNLNTGEAIATRPVYAYPMVPNYRGEGDPKKASSFQAVHLSHRQKR